MMHPIFTMPVKSTTFASWCLVVMISLILQYSHSAHAQSQPQVDLTGRNVLVLHALEANMPLNVRTDRAIVAALEAGRVGMRNQFFEYLDLQRNPGSEHRKRLAEMMHLRYGKRKIDIIISLYPEALEFLLKDCREILPDVPIVALYMAPGFELPKTGRRIIQHVFRTDMKGTLEIALKLVPGAKRVYVVGGVHALDKKNETQARQDFKKWESQLDFRYLSDMSLEEMLAAVSSAPPETVIFYMAMTGDITGKTYSPRDVAERLSQVSKGPVFGLYETLLGYGIVGGSIVSYAGIGTQAGQLALSILGIGSDSNKTSDILDVPGMPMFDWRELRRWNLNEAALPKGSIVINRELTFWDFRYYVLGALALCLAQSLLIAGLLLQRRRRRSAEESLRKKTEEQDQFFNVSLDLLSIANTDGYFLRLNPVWEKILGYSRDELTSKRFREFVHPDDVRDTQEALATLASQKAVTYFVNRYRCKDGRYRWLEWSASPAGPIIYCAARDITERKLAEQALEERLRFEQLLSDLSGRFVNIPSDRVDSQIEKGLRQILEFFQVERCGLIQVWPEKAAWMVTHVALAYDIPSPPVGVELPISIVPWVYDKLIHKGEMIAVSRLDDLPPEANRDKQTWIEWGVQSGMYIPIMAGESGSYVIAIDSMTRECVWPKEIIPRLRLLGEALVNILERKHAEEALRESERILRENENDLRRLAGRLIYAQEEERNRIARELHDDLAQRLAVFAIEVGKLEQQLMDPPAPVQEKLREMRKDVIQISQDVHSLSRQLHPSILDDLGLIKAVESECMNSSRREGIEIAFNHENIPAVIPMDVSLSLYRIVQEGLRNIFKHACADHVSVFLKGIDHGVLLSVQDNGIGFDSAEVKGKPGLGLSSMRERVKLIHGELSIQSQPEKGTLITVRVPLTKEGE